MSFFLLFPRALLSTATLLRRNFFSTFFFVVVLSLLLTFAHFLTLVTMVSDRVIDRIETKIDIRVLLQPDASDLGIAVLRKGLQQRSESGEIRDFIETTREEAMKNFARYRPEAQAFLEQNNLDNPISGMFYIIPSPEKGVITDIEQWILSDDFHEIVNQENFQKSIEYRHRLDGVLTALPLYQQKITLFRFFLLSILGVIVFIFLSFLVWRRHQEIVVMQLVGATYGFIRLPFFLETFFLITVSLATSITIFVLVTNAFLRDLVSFFGEGTAGIITHLSLMDAVFLNTAFLLFFSLFAPFWAVQRALTKENRTR